MVGITRSKVIWLWFFVSHISHHHKPDPSYSILVVFSMRLTSSEWGLFGRCDWRDSLPSRLVGGGPPAVGFISASIHSTKPQHTTTTTTTHHKHIHSTQPQPTTTYHKHKHTTTTVTNTHNHKHVRQCDKHVFAKSNKMPKKMFLLCPVHLLLLPSLDRQRTPVLQE